MMDNGWNTKYNSNGISFFKGYADRIDLSNEIDDIIIHDRIYKGNYCIIVISYDGTIKILHDHIRSFPIMYNTTNVTNLPLAGVEYKTVWADQRITMFSDFRMNNSYGICNEVPYKITHILENSTSDATIIKKIDSVLDDKIKNFVKHHKHIKCFLTGGLDSMLIYSYIKKYADIELIWGQHIDYDYFWCNHHTHVLQSNLTYPQIHHWRKPSILVSGTSGDEFMMRDPNITNLYLNYNKTDLITELNKNKECYHASYLSDENFMSAMKIQNHNVYTISQATYTEFINILIELVSNNMQHHHLGNTLTYTPLRDLQIFLYFCQLSFHSVLKQITDGYISKMLIGMNDESLLDYISPKKNNNTIDANVCSMMQENIL